MVLEDDKLWWFMSPQTILMAQWELGMQEVLLSSARCRRKMKFDLNGAANYNHYENQTATPTKGSFVLDVKKSIDYYKIKILGYDRGGDAAGGSFSILSLTPDKLILYNPASGTGWTLVYSIELVNYTIFVKRSVLLLF
jgi:hypothetical protein